MCEGKYDEMLRESMNGERLNYNEQVIDTFRGVPLTKDEIEGAHSFLASMSPHKPLKGIWNKGVEKEWRYRINGEGNVSLVSNQIGDYILFTKDISDEDRSKLLNRIIK